MSFPKILHRACQARHLSVRSTGRLTEGKKSSEEAGLARPFVDQMNLLDIISFRTAHAALINYLLGLDYLIIRLKCLADQLKSCSKQAPFKWQQTLIIDIVAVVPSHDAALTMPSVSEFEIQAYADSASRFEQLGCALLVKDRSRVQAGQSLALEQRFEYISI